jgi:hypothetical protein
MTEPEGRPDYEQYWTCSRCDSVGVCAPVSGEPVCRECRADLLEGSA